MPELLPAGHHVGNQRLDGQADGDPQQVLVQGPAPFQPDKVPEDPEELASNSKPGRIVVMGGTVPGHTTDAVSAMVAKALGADRIVNATSVDAVYTDDPRTNPDAEKILDMTIQDLENIVYKEHGASRSSVFDPLGVQIAKENRIDILIVEGRNLDELRNAIVGNDIKGTFVNSH